MDWMEILMTGFFLLRPESAVGVSMLRMHETDAMMRLSDVEFLVSGLLSPRCKPLCW